MAMLDEVKWAIKNKNFKNLSKPTKRNLIIIGAVLFILLLVMIIPSGNGGLLGDEELSKGFENSVIENQTADGNTADGEAQPEYIPPKLEDVQSGTATGPQNSSVIEKTPSNATAPNDKTNQIKMPKEQGAMPPPTNNPFVIQDTNPSTNAPKATVDDIKNIPDMSNASAAEQEAMVREIAKKQKPDDMIAFLKEVQNQFDFLKTQKQFKYDLKSYEVGDIFLWWEIEEITPVYIRFKDNDNGYAYNLRFLDDGGF